MRESNYCSPSQNKASIGITSAVYDRRALDCTAVLPLVNSLSHLSFLTSTSSRIREILIEDEGLERLVRILKEGGFKSRLDMWKWQLAFQCVVNVGIRGSERVRTRVVEAEMVPVIVSILEGFLERAERDHEMESGGEIRRMGYSFLRPMIGYGMMVEGMGRNGRRRWEMNEGGVNEGVEGGERDSRRRDIREGRLSVVELEESVRESMTRFSSMNEYVRGEFLGEGYELEEGVEIEEGNSGELVSSRERNVFGGGGGGEREGMEGMEEDNGVINEVYGINRVEEGGENGVEMMNERNSEIRRRESVQQAIFFDSRHFFFRNEDNVIFCLQLLAYISKYPQLRSYFQKSHDIPRLRYCNTGEIDEEKVTPINVFALVERFTLRIHPVEVQYWAGVIMRNACRKDESRGGIRQCAYIDCGRWETFNRQFAKCRRCRRTKYCSKQCQSRAWPGHRWWCRERASN
ncbi:hypothetical protein T552_00890 [Pneumocystis carinii B80]|uniref:MYND-type domain-containing protein n=1 Tax=Pneumocystis carinii (strain B80) TaxID=1408658 RepID=A0A0W4ZMT2_PNEC8|nr:hypothetical protein T552_00890 [Pneumocystis carinii B80]KTW29682.1 hypothetical protein T552_00890 [Pneumocystis carinii B80]